MNRQIEEEHCSQRISEFTENDTTNGTPISDYFQELRVSFDRDLHQLRNANMNFENNVRLHYYYDIKILIKFVIKIM